MAQIMNEEDLFEHVNDKKNEISLDDGASVVF
jgi:hypothetical protein